MSKRNLSGHRMWAFHAAMGQTTLIILLLTVSARFFIKSLYIQLLKVWAQYLPIKTPALTTDHFISLSVRSVTFNILGSHFMVPKNLLSSETDACDESQKAFTNCCSLTQVEECSYLTLSEGQLFLLQPHVAPFYREVFINKHSIHTQLRTANETQQY